MRARAAASIALASVLVTGLAGCNYVTTQATTFRYDPSDGIGATLGDLALRNVMAITEDGENVNLVFTVVNRSSEDIELTVSAGTGGDEVEASVELERGSTRVGESETQLVLEGVDVVPGSLLPVYFQYGSEPGQQLKVPVLDAELPEYDGLLPSPTPTPTINPEVDDELGPDPGETPAPSESPAP